MKKSIPLGPWPLGIDNVSDPTSVKVDDKGRAIALCDAVNVDVDRSGDIDRRRGRRPAVALPGLHSLWSGSQATYGVAQAVLYAITPTSARAIGSMPTDEPCYFAEEDGGVIVASRSALMAVGTSTIEPVGVPDASSPSLAPAAIGGLAAGRYAAAVSYLRGDLEGALSPLRTIALQEGQGLQLAGIHAPVGVDRVRVYRTALGGTVLYQCADLVPGTASYLLGNDTLGRQAPTQYLARMQGGDHLALWRGRALVARGRTLVVSEPMNYGLTSPRHGFVQFWSSITMLVGLEGGVYVGTRQGIFFLRGTRPGDWTQERKGALPPVRGQPVVIDGNQLPPNYQQAGRRVAVWVAANGFVLGCDDGSIIEPQGDRVRTPAAINSSICALSRRVTATLT